MTNPSGNFLSGSIYNNYSNIPSARNTAATISSQANFLLIAPQKLIQKYNESPAAFNQYVVNKADKYRDILPQIRSDYHKIRSLYHEVQGILVSRQNPYDRPAYPLTDNLLRKLIRKVNILLTKAHQQKFTGAPLFTLKKFPTASFGCLRNDSGLEIFDLTKLKVSSEDRNFLGAGCHVTIQKTYYISQGCLAALKISYSDYGNLDIRCTVKRLGQIHSENLGDSAIESLPLLHTMAYESVAGRLCERDMLITKLQNGGDLFTAIESGNFNPLNMKKSELLSHGIRLLEAVETLHSLDIIHGDIKPENLLLAFLSVNGEKVLEKVILTDFGGTKKISEDMIMNHNRLFCPAYSKGFFTKFDRDEEQALVSAYPEVPQVNKNEIFQNWISLNFRRDVFATVTTLWFLFYAESYPFDINKDEGYAEPDTIYTTPVTNHMGPKIRDILIAGMRENSWHRPMIRDILVVFYNRLSYLRSINQ